MRCSYCNHKTNEKWHLGILPPSDTFSATQLDALNVFREKLAIGICEKCGLTQNTVRISEAIRYEETNYAYNSANSEYARTHWANFVLYLNQLLKGRKSIKALEIGSNDGFCANEFKKSNDGVTVHGLDASPFQVRRSQKEYPDISFSRCLFGTEKDGFGSESFDIIYANNVVNHANDLRGFLNRVHELITGNGMFVFEVPALDMMFLNKKWDQIYHEHVSYFSCNSITHIMGSSGFEITGLEINDYHGGSLRVTCQKSQKKLGSLIPNFEADKIEVLKKYAERQRVVLQNAVRSIKSNSSKKIYFFGAPAKGVTFINYCEFSRSDIEGCLENSADKIGRFIPVAGIPIIDEEKVVKGSYVINLLWNVPKLFDNYVTKNELKEVKYEIT